MFRRGCYGLPANVAYAELIAAYLALLLAHPLKGSRPPLAVGEAHSEDGQTPRERCWQSVSVAAATSVQIGGKYSVMRGDLPYS